MIWNRVSCSFFSLLAICCGPVAIWWKVPLKWFCPLKYVWLNIFFQHFSSHLKSSTWSCCLNRNILFCFLLICFTLYGQLGLCRPQTFCYHSWDSNSMLKDLLHLLCHRSLLVTCQWCYHFQNISTLLLFNYICSARGSESDPHSDW